MNGAIISFRMSQDIYISRISQFVDEAMAKEEVFREKLNRTKIILYITKLMKQVPLQDFLAIQDDDLRQRIGKLMASQLVYGILDIQNIYPAIEICRNPTR
jgi:hypothetical protein